jgi:serine/threonine-protein kinase
MRINLVVTSGPQSGQRYSFDRHDTFVFGRSSTADCPVPHDGYLSRHHFLIEVNPPICLLKDLGSRNGTKVNGNRVGCVQLNQGDSISAGSSKFQVEIDPGKRTDLDAILCVGCGALAPINDTAIIAEDDQAPLQWLCGECIRRIRQFPSPPEGYLIDRCLGRGGMGHVYQARELATNRLVAIKMMIPNAASSTRVRDYFRREMEILKQLHHPNIVDFYDVYETKYTFQIIMEFVHGPNAYELISEQGKPLDLPETAQIGVQLLSALSHAHHRGFVHRDIKPSNLLISGARTRPVVKLSDFGLAKNFRDNSGLGGLTMQGDIGGSIGFLSPDHIRNFTKVKEPADIYSTAATLYFLLTGQYPFLNFDPNDARSYAVILENPALPIRARRPELPEAFDAVIRKGLEKQPQHRWHSAREMAAALEPFVD